MSRPPPNRRAKPPKGKPVASRFAPAAFVAGSPETVQRLCEELAEQAAWAFVQQTGKDWKVVGASLAQQLRASGHDLSRFDDSEDVQEWQATLYHPKGTFSLFLSFRASGQVEVTFRTDEATFSARG
jgi:hypothetical protein